MLTQKEIWERVHRQWQYDFNCTASDLHGRGYVVTEHVPLPKSRFRDEETGFLRVLCTGHKVVICASKPFHPWLKEHLLSDDPEWFLDIGNLRKLENGMAAFGYEIDQMPHFYLPRSVTTLEQSKFNLKWYDEERIQCFEGDERFGQAFVFDKHFPDVLGVAAVEEETILAMAGASADCEVLYQVGIDVISEHRGQGLGTDLVRQIKQALLQCGKVPYYGTSSSHLHSRNLAINAGFFPAWVELYSKKI